MVLQFCLLQMSLHWNNAVCLLQISSAITDKLANILWFLYHNCLHLKAPQYLTDYSTPISDVASQRHLCSARRHYLVVP